ncbi:hypothetical protein [Micromonospora sp. U21]|uniref:hypothetical protein n=1 Tax=Micromonospora sp. U21 TaxID=2824899 RepID=UPI001B39AC98|nr:hypothetical protein [Micromonospora sp. U21]MBQ0902679.1 hypothetical protein [Micromonospora sp. U21]
MSRIDWPAIITRAAAIVRTYSTGVTLRQLHYRLVSEQLYPNTQSAYKRLSSLTAEGRRNGTFPDLMDRGRIIHEYTSFADPEHALDSLLSWYRVDRTEDQDVSLYLGVEKAGMVEQLRAWFGHLGLPVLALGGYASQSYVRDVVDHQRERGRPAVLLYAGDHDPSGEDIDRDFTARTDCWQEVRRVALSAEQVRQYRLPPNPGKAEDSRAGAFVARHGELVQVELDALDPADLRQLFTAAIAEFWDTSAYESAIAREAADRAALARVAEGWSQ